MRHTAVELPKINAKVLCAFAAYADLYLRRNFHALRLDRKGRPADPPGPLIVVLNHAGWWDPLIALSLAMRFFPHRRHYAPIDAEALRKYRFFSKLGFFGIEPNSAAGAATLLRTGEAILRDPAAALWITGQGTFVDPRVRPVELRGGAAALLERTPEATVLPLAIEYPFWEEKHPEALACFGPAVTKADGIAPGLEEAQDLLATDAASHECERFDVLSAGRSGMGGIYDWWRLLRATLRGEQFRRAHGAERL